MRRTSLFSFAGKSGLLTLLASVLALGLVSQACSSSDSSATPKQQQQGDDDDDDDDEPKPSKKDSSAGDDDDDDDASTGDDGSNGDDASTGDGSACTAALPADLNGSSACKALPLGTQAIRAVMPDAQAPAIEGGALPAGIYDVSKMERANGKGGWRETLVLDGAGKFTRTREIDYGTGSGPNAITYTAGSYTAANKQLTLKTECTMGGTGEVGDSSTFSYGVALDSCQKTKLFYEVAGVRITLIQR